MQWKEEGAFLVNMAQPAWAGKRRESEGSIKIVGHGTLWSAAASDGKRSATPLWVERLVRHQTQVKAAARFACRRTSYRPTFSCTRRESLESLNCVSGRREEAEFCPKRVFCPHLHVGG